MTTVLRIAFLFLSLGGWSTHAQTARDSRSDLLQAIGYASATREGYEPMCRPNARPQQTPAIQGLCRNLDKFPDKVIESAVAPYLAKHFDESLARQAADLWSSKEGRDLSDKIQKQRSSRPPLIRLTPREINFLTAASQSPHGQALRHFGEDFEAAVAVAQVLLTNAPSDAGRGERGFEVLPAGAILTISCLSSAPVVPPTPHQDFRFEASVRTADGRDLSRTSQMSCTFAGHYCGGERGWEQAWETSGESAKMQFSMGTAGELTVGFPSCEMATAIRRSSAPQEGWQCAQSNCLYDRGKGRDDFVFWDYYTRPESIQQHGFRITSSSMTAQDR